MGPPPEPSEAPPGRAQATAKAATTKAATAKAPTTKAAPATSATAKTAPAKAASSPARAKATKAPSTRKRAGGSGPRALRQRADATADTVAGPRRPRGAGWNRALYSRPLQRRNEHWPLVTRALATLLRHPDPVLAALGSSGPVERDGRVLNRNTQAMLALANRYGASRPGASGDAGTQDPVVMRRQLRISARLAMPVRTDVHVEGRIIRRDTGSAGIPVRVYRRFGVGVGAGPDDKGRPPAIVFFHGGGWVVGDLDTHDGICRLLAATSRCVVVSVGYRLAPEHPFPAAVDDSLAAYEWVHRNGDELGIATGQVGVMGDSAGGTLAAVVAQQTLGGGDGVPPPTAQALIYPAVDSHLDSASLRSVGDEFMLTRVDMEYFRRQYLPDRSGWDDPRASPLLADDLTGLAPALVVTAGFDPLRDDGMHYAEALRKGGVDVEYRCYHDQIHGFMGMGILPDSLALATEVCDAMGQLMRRSAGAVEPWS